jgi:hypothetical protein
MIVDLLQPFRGFRYYLGWEERETASAASAACCVFRVAIVVAGF